MDAFYYAVRMLRGASARTLVTDPNQETAQAD